MISLGPEIKLVKVHPLKCPKCKLTVMVKPSEKVCPVCGSSFLKAKEIRKEHGAE